MDLKPSTQDTPLVLSLDIGTSSIRCLLFDFQGKPLESVGVSIAHAPFRGQDGTCEFNPVELRDRLAQGIDRILLQLGPRPVSLEAVAISLFAGSLLGLDEEGRPLTRLWTYGDTRSHNQVQALQKQFDLKILHQTTGCPLHASYWPAQLRFIQQTDSGLYKRVKTWTTLGAYLLGCFTGHAGLSPSEAAWTGLLDIEKMFWEPSLQKGLSLDTNQLLRVTDNRNQKIEGLAKAYLDRWPQLKKARWFPAVVDGVAANMGSGCSDDTRVAVTLGTSAAVRWVTSDVRILKKLPSALFCYRADETRFIVGGALTDGGQVLDWLKQTLILDPVSDLDSDLLGMKPDSHGLTILPTFSGERSPGWNPKAQGLLAGLTLETSPLQIAKAGMEAVACRLALVFSFLKPFLKNEVKLWGSGGALVASSAWRQVIADALGQDLYLPGVKEASARGAALMALEQLQPQTKPAFQLDWQTKCVFDQAAHRKYQAVVQRQNCLEQSLSKEA